MKSTCSVLYESPFALKADEWDLGNHINLLAITLHYFDDPHDRQTYTIEFECLNVWWDALQVPQYTFGGARYKWSYKHDH